jgi:GNAT superfamily N-acetyltransferase
MKDEIGLRIRDARPAEGGAVVEVTLAAYGQYAAVVPEHWERYRQNIVATLSAAKPGTLIVADEGAGLVGSVLLYPAGGEFVVPGGQTVTLKEPEVRLLAVAPAARGRGVGVALMHECIRRARESRAPTLTLHTMDMMQAAMRMYERLGFQRAPELDIDVAPGVTIKGYRLLLEAEA